MPNVKKNTQQMPDCTYSVKPAEILATVLGPADKPFTEKEISEKITSLGGETLIAALTILENRASMMEDVCSILKKEIGKRPAGECTSLFGSATPLVSITDSVSGENYGGIKITREIKKKYSTETTSNRDAVVKALDQEGISANYGVTQYRLDNGKLFEALNNGALPSSVSSLLKETEVEKIDASYVKPLKQTATK